MSTYAQRETAVLAMHYLAWAVRQRYDRERRKPVFPRRQHDCLAMEAERIGLNKLAGVLRSYGYVIHNDERGYPMCPCPDCEEVFYGFANTGADRREAQGDPGRSQGNPANQTDL